MRFRVGAFAARAAESEQAVAMFAIALANCAASPASHCFSGFCLVQHDYFIQRPLVVCQEESAKMSGNAIIYKSRERGRSPDLPLFLLSFALRGGALIHIIGLSLLSFPETNCSIRPFREGID